MITLEFLITSLIVVLIPGTGMIHTVSTGLLQGLVNESPRVQGWLRYGFSAAFAALGARLAATDH